MTKCYNGISYQDYPAEKPPVDEKEPPVDTTTTTTTTIPSIITRKNQASMSDEEKNRFKSAIESLIQSGFYTPHVNVHENMTHRMHSMAGPIGTQRFLPWHRVYLARLEEALRQIDDRIFIPYWKWVDDRDIPDWLSNFTPTGITQRNGTSITITRAPGTLATNLPTRANMESVIARNDWTSFTSGIEAGHDPLTLGAHNLVHVWVGGTMSSIPTAPADPLFWLHHAEIDRQWHIWQQNNSGTPILSGANAILDPWPEDAANILDINDLRYTYQEPNNL